VKITEIDDRLKMADYIQLIPAYAFWAIDLQYTGDFEGAVSKNLKALEYSERTSSNLYIGLVYECLVMEYAFTGDMARAEYYFEKLMSLPQGVLSSAFNQALLGIMKATYYAGKNQFEESNRYFNDYFEFVKVAPTYPSMIFAHKQSYAWCLSRQGRFEEAKAQVEQAQQLRDSELEKFGRVNVVASLMTLTRPTVGKTFSLRLDLVNVSRSTGLIVRVENLLVPELKIVDFPADCTMRDGYVEFKDNTIKPFEVKTIKLTVQATKPQVFNLNPAVTYADELAQTKTTGPRSFTITVQPIAGEAKVAGKTTTGFNQLDDLLLGGIPDGYAIALTSPALEERLRIVERFVEAGVKNGQVTFYLTDEPRKAKTLAKEFPKNMYLFVCNPRANLIVEDLPNVFKLKGVDNLTDIDIALTKACRQLDASWAGPKRACIEITSDVLLQHHAVTTRKWLSGLIQDLKSKGFTILAVVDSQIHPPEELEAILGVFDGEIRLSEKMTPEGTKQTMKIRKLYNQKYLNNEVIVNKDWLAV
jgi:KaiC/GvpD/RAD55 family RecA-like ATPase